MAYVFGIDGTEKFIPDERTYENIQQEYSNDLHRWNQSVSRRLANIRGWRTAELIASDWTQVSDNALDSSTKTAWAEYRTKLRNLPAVAEASGFVTSANWPLPPGQSEISSDVHEYINSFTDPLGVAVTSYITQRSASYEALVFQNPLYEFPAGESIIAVGTTSGILVDDIISVGSTSAKVTGFNQSTLTQEHNTFSVGSVGIGTTIICVGSVDGISHGDTFTTIGDTTIDRSANITVTGIGTTSIILSSGITTSVGDNQEIFILRPNNNSISLGSTLSTSIAIGDTITVTRDRVEYFYEEDKVPTIGRTLTSNKTNLLENETADFTLNITNTFCEQRLAYEVSLIEGWDRGFDLNDIITTPSSGEILIIPATGATSGVSTISVGIAQTIGITSESFVLKVDILDVFGTCESFGIGKTVGVSTV
tara:strand:+ start:4375 stop:5646 length:1272 start_codon:yes stop_codon:yes gene_type:complete